MVFDFNSGGKLKAKSSLHLSRINVTCYAVVGNFVRIL